MDKVRFGVIGCGSIGQHHLKQLKTLENAIVSAACDVNTGSLERFGMEAGLTSDALHGDYQDLLESGGIDAVVICLPNRFHSPVSVEAFKQGLHVFCEKPMAHTVEDCDEMIKACEANKVKLFMVWILELLFLLREEVMGGR